MKKPLLLSALLLTSLSVAFVSCKKEDKQKSSQELIVGTWNRVTIGVDTNRNGKLDSVIDYTMQLAGDSSRETFNADGSGVWTSYFKRGNSTDKRDFTWSFSNEDKSLRLINKRPEGGKGNPPQEADTVNTTVIKLTQNYLEFSNELNDRVLLVVGYSRQ